VASPVHTVCTAKTKSSTAAAAKGRAFISLSSSWVLNPAPVLSARSNT
jgi:hypothetical protein